MILLELPYPPTLNHFKKIGATRRTKRGCLYQTRVNSPQTDLFYQQVWIKIRTNKMQSLGKAKMSMEIDVHAPDKRKRDIDNVVKCIFDALQRGGLYDDDFQIDRLLVERKNVIVGGAVVVRIAVLD